MKLLVNISTDYHLNHLPHFLKHYFSLGVELFICGVHGNRFEEAMAILDKYPRVVCLATVQPFDGVAFELWRLQFNAFREKHVNLDEWCLYADVDEFHEYPDNFFSEKIGDAT